LAGRYGDGWLPTTPSVELYAEQWEQVKSAAVAAERPTPTAGLCTVVVFGPSRDEIFAKFEAEPLSKMIMLFQPASVWQRYGLEHPAGPQTRGWIDTIPHELDPELIRSAVAQIPERMLDERLLIGNAEEIAKRLGPFADAGLEHVVICDITGMVYPPEEAAVQLGELAKLCDLVHGADTFSLPGSRT
jgi:phthiodiolone/phenolphthiodiolone dimycocerosates ketoreductase